MYAMGVYSFCLFCVSVCQSVSLSVNIYFVSKISQELLYLETWNFVHMTSMTSCIVGKKIRAMGPGPLELCPFVVLAILMAMAFICVKGTTLPRNLKFCTHDKYD